MSAKKTIDGYEFECVMLPSGMVELFLPLHDERNHEKKVCGDMERAEELIKEHLEKLKIENIRKEKNLRDLYGYGWR